MCRCYERGIPSSIRREYDQLAHDLDALHVQWLLWRQLFDDPDRVDVLNRTAGFFFRVTQLAFVRDLVIGISRLLDPAQSGPQRQNLVLEVLVEGLRSVYGCRSLLLDLDRQLEEMRGSASPLITVRNKRLAHRDHGTALAADTTLPGVSRSMIEDQLARGAKFMNSILLHFEDTERAYEDPTIHGGDGRNLVEALARGQAARRREPGPD